MNPTCDIYKFHTLSIWFDMKYVIILVVTENTLIHTYNTLRCLLWNIFRMLHKLLLTNFYYAKLLATFSFKLQIILEEHISFCTEICNWYQTFKLFAYNGLFGLCYAADPTIQLTTVLDKIRILYNPFLLSRLYIILCLLCLWVVYVMGCVLFNKIHPNIMKLLINSLTIVCRIIYQFYANFLL